jgi:hypothetical protein
MIFTTILAFMRKLLGARLNPFARGAWCRRQRHHLAVPGHSVVWLRGDALSWAEWGARRGYFEVQQMEGLSYLRARGAPVV